MAMIGAAPTALAPSTALSPTPPQPKTATRSPGRTPAVFQTTPMPVVTAQPTRAAMSSGIAGSMRTHDRAGTTARSANDEMNE